MWVIEIEMTGNKLLRRRAGTFPVVVPLAPGLIFRMCLLLFESSYFFELSEIIMVATSYAVTCFFML